MMLRWLFAVLGFVVCVSTAKGYSAEPPSIRTESIHLTSGADLITAFEQLPLGAAPVDGRMEIPIIAVLNTGGRLRNVWVFTYSSPSLAQRAAAAVPFFYHRSGLEGADGSKPPRPAMDLAAPAHGIWQRVAMMLVQTRLFDPAGAIYRLITRSYGGNLSANRRAHVLEAVDVLNAGPEQQLGPALSKSDVEMISSRLSLNTKIFGGLVSQESLPRFHEKAVEFRSQNRGHNWELLRQSAEENGLCFEPLPFAGMAMVSIAQKDLTGPGPKVFNRQFLRISNPFGDERLRSWNGYVDSGMIPLAVYSLDYPGVPLLLIDFRRGMGPKLGEIVLRASDDVATGVLGFTGFGNWDYLAVKSSWMFVHKRHGGTTNRGERERAFAQLRHSLGTDASLDPAFRKDLMERLNALALDPVERSWDQEAKQAWLQYRTLLKSEGVPDSEVENAGIDRTREQTGHDVHAPRLEAGQ